MFIICPEPLGGDQWEGVSARMLSHDILFFPAPSPYDILDCRPPPGGTEVGENLPCAFRWTLVLLGVCPWLTSLGSPGGTGFPFPSSPAHPLSLPSTAWWGQPWDGESDLSVGCLEDPESCPEALEKFGGSSVFLPWHRQRGEENTAAIVRGLFVRFCCTRNLSGGADK